MLCLDWAFTAHFSCLRFLRGMGPGYSGSNKRAKLHSETQNETPICTISLKSLCV